MQFIDLGAQRRHIQARLKAAIDRVVEGGQYILGPEVGEFEARIADYLGVRHAIACANGTDALLLALMAADIGPGDAVFCPSYTFAATAEVVALRGAEPVFVDVDAETYNMVPAALAEAVLAIKAEGRLTPRAVIPVDLFGLAADYDAIDAIAERENLMIIEDAAQAIGFYPAKPLGCYGDGGAMFTDNDDLAELLRSLRFHGKGDGQYDNRRIGVNSRLDTIQAAILIEKLAILEEEMEARQRVAQRYAKGLGDVVRVPHIPEHCRSAFAQYAIELPGRDGLKAHLHENGIPSVVYYPKPLHLQPAYEKFPQQPRGLPVSEALPERILCLPMHAYLGEDDQDLIIDTIRQYVLKNAEAAE